VRLRRARAYSARPEDQACVEFERMIWRGTLAVAAVGQNQRSSTVSREHLPLCGSTTYSASSIVDSKSLK
jgi:hypothetical protein